MERNLQRLTKNEKLKDGKHFAAHKKTVASYPLHAHDFFEIEIILSGKGTQTINSERYPLSRGSVCLLTPADFHELTIEGHATLWNIVFDETVPSARHLQRLFRTKLLYRSFDESVLFKLDRVTELIAAESKENGYAGPLLDYLLEILLPREETGEETTPIRRAILYIETHFREDPSLAQAAEQACLSPVYFGNLFKKVTGETYISYLNRCKVNRARMLLESGLPVAQVCFDSGFGSLSGFLYTFKQKTGVSPKEYKEGKRLSDSVSARAKSK